MRNLSVKLLTKYVVTCSYILRLFFFCLCTALGLFCSLSRICYANEVWKKLMFHAGKWKKDLVIQSTCPCTAIFLALQDILVKLGLIFWMSQNSDSKYFTLNGISILTLLLRAVQSIVTNNNAQSCKASMFISLFSMCLYTSDTNSVTTMSSTCLWEKYTRSDVWDGVQLKEDITVSLYKGLLNAFI